MNRTATSVAVFLYGKYFELSLGPKVFGKIKNKNNIHILIVTLCTGFLLLALASWQILDPVSMASWAQEDGPFENATAIFYGLSAWIFIILAKRGYTPPSGSPKLGFFFLVLWAVGSFFIMAEEISWGQRIFGIETPEAMKKLNFQGEITLHNLQFVYDLLINRETSVLHVDIFLLMVTLTGVVFPLVALTGPGRQLLQKYAFPVVPARYSFLFLGALIYGEVFYDPGVAHLNAAVELREFMFSLGVLVFALHGLFRPGDLYRVSTPDIV